MPNDNAELPPTIHLGYLPDEIIVAHLRHGGTGRPEIGRCIYEGRCM
jgi:hypothetical protein